MGLLAHVMTLYDCPECALPATATPRPLGHVFVRCVTGHWFLGPVEMLMGDRYARRETPGPPPS